MSYYQSSPNYYRNPVPYLSSDIGEPVPGWGVHTPVAGPSRLGVGQYATKLSSAALMKQLAPGITLKPAVSTTPSGPQPTAEDKVTPWWIWPLGAAVLVGGVGYYGTKKGWF